VDDDDVVVRQPEKPAAGEPARIEELDLVPGESPERGDVLEDVRRMRRAVVAKEQD